MPANCEISFALELEAWSSTWSRNVKVGTRETSRVRNPGCIWFDRCFPPARTDRRPRHTPKPAATAPASTAKQIDINKASKKELMTLPGIGDVYADRIIKGRPFKGKDDIMSDKVGVPQATYDKIKDMIIAKQK